MNEELVVLRYLQQGQMIRNFGGDFFHSDAQIMQEEGKRILLFVK